MDLIAIFRFLGEGKRKDAWAVSRAHQNFVFRTKRSAIPNAAKIRNSANGNLSGMYKRSIVWDFFAQKKRHFTDLDPSAFL
jgi:hypothetical protein